MFIPPSSPKITPTTAVSIAFNTPTALQLTTTATLVTPLAGMATATAALTPESTSASVENTPTVEPPSPTPNCSDAFKYLADVNYPDGTIVSPGAIVEKQWRVENLGSCDWDGRYRLKLVNGFPALGAPSEMALFPARAGTQAILTIPFTAPQEAGTYQTYWQAYNPAGIAFGEAIYMLIVVQP